MFNREPDTRKIFSSYTEYEHWIEISMKQTAHGEKEW